MKNKHYDTFVDICKRVSKWNANSLPLCAAENVISPFCKIPLDTFLQEKYIMGGIMDYDNTNNFIGSSNLFEFYQFINQQCATLFSSKYADPRTLSGVNAVTTLLMGLFNAGDTVLISGEDYGGHSSMPKICHRLGIKTIELPYDFDSYDFDYDAANKMIKDIAPEGILICLSDLLDIPALYKFELPPATTLIFDATQILGLLAGDALDNPFNFFSDDQNFVLMGATHKTLPGPTCGLIMTRNSNLAQKFDTKINPDYLRNNQFHHILSLSLTLLEMECFGNEYAKNIVANANKLGAALEKRGFSVIHNKINYTNTHQLYVSMKPNDIDYFINNCEQYRITLNARYRKIYRSSGIRIGTQEVTRYGWGSAEMELISEILYSINQRDISIEYVEKCMDTLLKRKKICYSFSQDKYEEIYRILHYN